MDQPSPRPSPAAWVFRIWPRVRVLLPIKAVGTAAGMSAFFVAYFFVLRHPVRPVTVVPLTPLDDLVPFLPAALPLYASLWLYVSLPPALIVSGRILTSYGAAVVGLSVAGLAIFYLFPTAVPPAAIDLALHPSFRVIKGVDAAGNACPSLHVAFAVFSAPWLECGLRAVGAGGLVRLAGWLWGVGIVVSTMATRQHVAIDVACGAALGAAVAAGHLRWVRANG